jgi:DNA-binding winged helix-turn-helix (wHTH) protein
MRVEFGRFAFDPERRELLDGTRRVHLGPQAFRLLEILIASRPRPLRKKDLYESIWQDTFVDESNLAGLVNELRTALGDRARKPRFIRTVHGYGYAFCGDLKGEKRPARAGTLVFRGRELPLQQGANILGRDASADIQIEDATVSRKHAVITIREDGATIDDLDSKNGTFVGGLKLKGTAPLAEGQTFVLGDASIVFRRGSAASTVSVIKSSIP